MAQYIQVKCKVILFLVTLKSEKERWKNERKKKENSKPERSNG
jgi:hypothetical protein